MNRLQEYFDVSYIWSTIPELLPYVRVTFLVTLLSVVFGSLLGFILAFMKLSKSNILIALANAYITVMRCTPAVVMLFLVYYGIPAFSERIFGIDLEHVPIGFYVVATFTFMFAGMMAEVIRSAIEAIDPGQYEAAVSVGLTPVQAYIRIIIPQAMVVGLPNFANGLIAVLQDGALAYTIGFIDVVGKANLIIAGNYGTHMIEVYIVLIIFYWALTLILEKVFERLEVVLSKGSRSLKTT